MKTLTKLTLPAAGLTAAACMAPAQPHPNIIYILPDQYRNAAMSFWDEPEYRSSVLWRADPVHTPNLNRLAAESIVFSRASSNCPLSSPHRGIFHSGMYPERSGVILNCMQERPESNLRQDAVCISDVLKAQGYSCGYIGKLHTDFPTKNNPQRPGTYVGDRTPEWDAYTPKERRHGFDYWYSYGTFNEHKNPHYWDTEGRRHDPKEFSVNHETDKAIEYLRNRHGERAKGAPFFLVVAYNPPHSPYSSADDCTEEDLDYYRNLSYKELYVRENADTTMKKAPAARYYFANVTGVDRNVGRILDELKRLGLEEDTIVIFTSDHGETLCSHGVNEPKNSIWTESFNVPYLIRYPGKIRHRVDSTLFSSIDIMPTLLSLAGCTAQIPETAEGRDIAPHILENGGQADLPTSALYMRNVNGPKDENGLVRGFFPVARGLRTAAYSLSIAIDRKYRIDKVLLYDNVKDPYQLHNLGREERPELFRALCGELRAKLEEADDCWYREKIMDRLGL